MSEPQAAVVRYEPKRPLGSAGTLQALLSGRAKAIADLIPEHLTADKLLKLSLVAVRKTPKLYDCTQESILQAIITAGELGLNPSGTLGEAYLIPYDRECTFIPGFRGLAKLARQSGEIKRIDAEVVYQNDHFDYRKGTQLVLDFRQALTDRGKPVGAYALVEFKDGGLQSEFMSFDEIEASRKMSKAGRSGPWVNHWGEMARKTVFRRLSKWLPLSSEKWDKALAADNADHDLERSAGASVEADNLNVQLGLKDAEEVPEVEAEEVTEEPDAQAVEGEELFT